MRRFSVPLLTDEFRSGAFFKTWDGSGGVSAEHFRVERAYPLVLGKYPAKFFRRKEHWIVPFILLEEISQGVVSGIMEGVEAELSARLPAPTPVGMGVPHKEGLRKDNCSLSHAPMLMKIFE